MSILQEINPYQASDASNTESAADGKRSWATIGFLLGAALSLYFLVQAVIPFVGAYPVPLAGMGSL